MNLKHPLTLILLLCGFAAGCNQQPNRSAEEKRIDKQVNKLLSQMTVEEKIGQLNQLSALETMDVMMEMIGSGSVGSVLNETNPEVINAMQKIAVEQSRLGIPLLIARDVIHGFRTILPIPLGLAATFDPALVEQGARVAAVEATASGVRWTFSPMLDIARDPRWGRVAEGSGEDTYLNVEMSKAMVNGYQRADFSDPTCLAACAKHFVGYGAAEGGRDYNSTHLTERQLRDDYFPPFEAAIRSGALTLMTSFNDNDGIPATGNAFLLKDVLRKEWAFDGVVVTDWNSAGEMIAHGFVRDGKDAADKSINAGVDVDMMSYSYINNLKALLDEGLVSKKTLDNAVRNVLRLKFRLGLFENPYVDPVQAAAAVYTADNLEVARKSAVASAILLKNDKHTLPLSPVATKRLLLAGPMANAPYDQLGTWVFDGQPEHTVTPLAAFREHYGDKVEVVYHPVLPYSRSMCSAAELAAFTAQARTCDAVAVFVGEESILSGEAHCLASLDLQGSQSALLEAARKSGRPVVAVVMAGRPLTIARDLENTDALLYSFHPGTMGGVALAQLIFGDEVPSGKLPMTIPVSVGQIPIYYNHRMTGRPCSGRETLLNDIPLAAGQTSLGCTSYYLDAGFGPLYPFGYGLSYTTFEYGMPKLDKATYAVDDTISVSFDLTNTGGRDATEVVQVYVRDLVGSVTRPVKELKAFERVALIAGEKRQITIQLPVSRLAFGNLDGKYAVEAGEFQLWAASDSSGGEPITFNVK